MDLMIEYASKQGQRQAGLTELGLDALLSLQIGNNSPLASDRSSIQY
jgi:hypothetical protein